MQWSDLWAVAGIGLLWMALVALAAGLEKLQGAARGERS